MTTSRLLYISRFTIDQTKGPILSQLNQILQSSNRHNETNQITGALIFDSNWFVQILEGQREAVWATFKRIEADPRHSHILPLDISMTPGRRFGKWWMGCAERTPANAAIFAPYLRGGAFEPDTMLSIELLSLMVDLADAGLQRELTN